MSKDGKWKNNGEGIPAKEWMTSDKLKYIAGTAVITVVVFLSFKYLFGIVWPFAIGYLIALAIEKPVNKLAKCFGGRKTPASTIIVIVLTALILAATGYIAYLGFYEIRSFAARFDYYMIGIRQQTARICLNMDSFLGLRCGCTLDMLEGGVKKLGDIVSGADGGQTMTILTNIVTGSLPIMIQIIIAIGAVVVCFISVVYFSNVLDVVRDWRMKTVFREEVCVVTASLNRLLNVYFKLQLIIMAINSSLCIGGLMLIGNPYAVVIGVLIGVVDALPFFGTGTILIPWALVELVLKKWQYSAILLVVYLITYFTREIMESKCMGDKLGISSITMLLVIFMGIMVYGILGFILGPISYVIIKALVQYLKTIIERDKLGDVL